MSNVSDSVIDGLRILCIAVDNGGIMHDQRRSDKDRNWWPVIAAAVIGAIATIVGGLIANGTGAVHIAIAPVPTLTVTVTPAPAPTVTVTKSSGSSGAVGPTSCSSGQNCKVYNLIVQLGSNGSSVGVNFDTGLVSQQGNGDLYFETSSIGMPELVQDLDQSYSINITPQTAGKQQCQSATTSAPDANPITNFHTGLVFCVAPGGNDGIALVEETQPLGSSNTLHLKDIFWPSLCLMVVRFPSS
jgi:hypothetical protein